jgi:protease-4
VTATAVETGLVDKVAEAGEWLKRQPGPVRHYKKKGKNRDLDSFAGIMAAVSELLNGAPETKHARAVAVVELEGSILDGSGGVPGYAITGRDTAALFDRLADDTRIVAVVVRVNSPGGSAGASDRIHFAIRRCAARKPVVALFDQYAASGGYYLGCAAHEILVHRGTITGSIGVFSLIPDIAETRRMLGINRFQITTGPRAALFDLEGFGPEKEAAMRQVIEAVDKRFQGLVAERRKLDPDKVKELAGGRVFTGEEAVTLGLADGIGDLPGAVARARELAKEPQPLPLERFPKANGLAAKLGLGSVLASQAGMPVELLQWMELARAGKPLVLCWAPVMSVR